MNWVGVDGGSWDPVENASLMPWFIATALMHSLIVTEKRDYLMVSAHFLPSLLFL